MKSMKELLLEKGEKNPELFFPINAIKELGFKERKCKKCGRTFYSLEERDLCGDCEDYSFIGKKRSSLSYGEINEKFKEHFKKRGYLPVERYPSVAKWRDDLEFTIASIAAFQPYVTKGIVEPPSKKLTIPQFSIRFNDIDNVGLTGRHFTGFIMLGQHAFVRPEEYDINQYFKDLFSFFVESLNINAEELVLHKDGWYGGGNAGTSVEIFSKGLELANQVYMQFEVKEGEIKPLEKLKILDMGAGLERFAWFLNGSKTAYDSTFPKALEFLKKESKVELDDFEEIFRKFLPFSGELNIEEITNIEKKWEEIAKKIGVEKKTLKEAVSHFSSYYFSIEHLRTSLIAIGDGKLPSNSGGGYNLRVILRRAFDGLNYIGFEGDLIKILELIKEDLWFYKELEEFLTFVPPIIEYERKKHEESKEKLKRIIEKIKKEDLSTDKLIELYVSKGITPQMIKERFNKDGLDFKIPDDFYTRLTEFKEKSKRKEEKKEEMFIPAETKETELVYYKDEYLFELEGVILEKVGDYYIFDKTIFYPLGGGQIFDKGYVISEGEKYDVLEVIKEGKWVLHKIKGELKKGQKIKMFVDKERRLQLMRHHTATHILNYASRKILGKHIWQAGAEKTEEKARLDITHYKLPTEEEIQKIEWVANEVVLEGLKVKKEVLERNEAEKRYSHRIYQGGAVPGKYLRIVSIDNLDHQACGGTHVNNTLEVGLIKIKKVERIQDGVVRIEFVAGKRAIEEMQKTERLLKESSSTLQVGKEELPKTIKRFFEEWKERRKTIERLRKEYALLLKKLLKNGEMIIEVSEDLDIKTMEEVVKNVNEAVLYNRKYGVGKGTIAEEVLKEKFEKIINAKGLLKGFKWRG